MSDSVSVATSGNIDRDEVCAACGAGMYYRRSHTTGQTLSMFCPNIQGECLAALKELPLPERVA